MNSTEEDIKILKELISLLYQDKLTNFGKDQLVGIIEKLLEG